MRLVSRTGGRERELVMAEILTPDICVIGAGAGGLTVAAAAAAFGVPVVLVEKGKMGGDCLYTGCVPSKSLIAAAKHARALARANAFGVSVRGVDIDFAGVHKHVHEVIAAIEPNDSRERFTALGVHVIEGAAGFRDAQTVMVSRPCGGEIEIKARRFVIATGSSPSLPPIPGLDGTAHLTNETVFDLTARPERLIVIGAGPLGLELAQAFRRLGSAVTVLEAGQPLAREDPECAGVVLEALSREGVDIRTGLAVARVEPADGQVKVVIRGECGEETLRASHLLLATGRRANTDGLGLDRAGIRHDGAGIAVDKGLKTTNKRVYAIGDVVGGAQFTHLASYHAGLVIRNALFRLPVRVNEDAVPRVTFTDPELAHVGLTEAQARRRGLDVRVLRWPYHDNDRAQAERETLGHIKLITSRRGRILGASIVGAAAGELITTWTLAIARGLGVRSLAGIIVPYPTLAEVGKRAATTYFIPGLTSGFVQRIIAWLRRFG
jgi:pyruvate/2-oxoglutarate dehydrogenase complex dihydrolipoamide dehydrogenase (E3) component